MSEANNFYKEEQFSDYPSNWNVLTLKNLVSQKITYGIVQPGQHENAGIPLIRGVDYMNGWQDIGTFFKVAPSLHSQYARSVTRKGDVLLSIAGYAGEVAIVPEWILEANITQTTARISVDSDIADPKFVASFLSSQKGRNQSKRYTKGSAQEGLNLGDVENFYVPIPPLAEQNKIASILTSVDEVIENTQKQIEKLQDLKKATMNELLTKGIGHTDFKESKLGRIPRSWETKRFGEISRQKTLGTTERGGVGVMVPLIKMGDIQSGNVLNDANEKVSKSKLVANNFLSYGDFLFNTRNTPELVGKVGNYSSNKVAAFDNNLLKIDFIEDVSPLFMGIQFNESTLKKRLRTLVAGTTSVAAIYWNDLSRFWVLKPHISEQKEIATIILTIETQIDAQKSKLSQIQSLKKSLMQDLLTGKVRVQVN